MSKRRLIRWNLVMLILLFLLIFVYYQNNALQVNHYVSSSTKIPPSFDQYKIVHLSDLHSKRFYKNQSRLVNKVRKATPDMIVFTGDVVDQKRYNEENSMMLMQELVEIAPVYFVTGNHEWWSGKYDSLERKLIDTGVHVLRNGREEVFVDQDSIHLIGIDDPAIDRSLGEEQVTEEAIKIAIDGLEMESYTILLAHRPEHFSLYVHNGFDLILAGHAHGGQFKLPFVGGVVAPNQGFFPTYVSGKYEEENSTMIVNRGLGNSIIPIRLFNRPEIGVVTLISE